MASDMVRIEVGVETNKVGSECTDIIEVPRSEWEAKTPGEKQAFMDDCLEVHIGNSIDSWATVLEDEG